MARWLNVLGINMAAYLDEHQMPGAVHRVGFDNWYPGFLDFTHIFRKQHFFFHRDGAPIDTRTPHFITVDEFSEGSPALNVRGFYSSPWKGGWWRAERRRALHAGRIDGGAGHGGKNIARH